MLNKLIYTFAYHIRMGSEKDVKGVRTPLDVCQKSVGFGKKWKEVVVYNFKAYYTISYSANFFFYRCYSANSIYPIIILPLTKVA